MPSWLQYHPEDYEKEKEEPQPEPTRYQFNGDDTKNLGQHLPNWNFGGVDSSGGSGGGQRIKVSPDQLNSWASLFETGSTDLNDAGDFMNRIKVQPGYFMEANTIRDLVSTFNSTFVPNLRILSDTSGFIGRTLKLVSENFSNTEKVNLDTNTNLVDMISSMTKLETGLKPTEPIRPNTPSKK